jgi:hypothetical protein
MRAGNCASSIVATVLLGILFDGPRFSAQGPEPSEPRTEAPVFSQPVPTINFVVRAGEYHATMYVARPTPPAVFLVFKSEALSLSLDVGNATDVDRSLTLDALGPSRAFSVKSIRIPAEAAPPRLLVNPIAELNARGLKSAQPWAGTIEVPSTGTIVWSATLTFEAKATPGVYELQITPNFGLSDGSRLNPQGTLVRYEVREAVSLEDRAELARRRMMHEYNADAEVEAEAAADALLRLYPQSALAYQVKGEIARRQHRLPQAVQLFERAVQLMTSGQDVLFVTHAPAYEVDRMVETVRQTVQVLQQRQP